MVENGIIYDIRLEKPMTEYTLYLDESEIPITDENNNEINKLFVIAGIIASNEYHDTKLTESLNKIKDVIWDKPKDVLKRHSYILHEMEVTAAHYGSFGKLKHKYHRVFAKPSKYNLLYEKMSELIQNSELTTLGACIRQNELHSLYNHNILNDKKSILMQIIIENYYHFLVESDSIGTICYESMPKNQNAIINKRYKYIKNTGTMFYPAKKINSRIKGLIFVEKDKNVTGLQIADFIPNTLGRVECEKDSNSEANYKSVHDKLYDGNRKMIEKFGLKIIP